MAKVFAVEEDIQAEELWPPQYLGSLLVTCSCSLLGNKRAGTNEGSLVMMKSFCLFITMLMGLALCLFGGRRSMRGLLPWIQGIASAMLLVTAILSYLEWNLGTCWIASLLALCICWIASLLTLCIARLLLCLLFVMLNCFFVYSL